LFSFPNKENLAQLLHQIYPEYEWLPWRFEKVPNGYWDDINNQKKYLTWVEKELNINKLSDWYKVSAKVIIYPGIARNKKDLTDLGSLLTIKYNKSIVHFLSTFYPEQEWLPWKFEKIPYLYWDDILNQRKFMEWAAKQLNVKDLDDWCKVPVKVSIIWCC
jgi:hypothetical protein